MQMQIAFKSLTVLFRRNPIPWSRFGPDYSLSGNNIIFAGLCAQIVRVRHLLGWKKCEQLTIIWCIDIYRFLIALRCVGCTTVVHRSKIFRASVVLGFLPLFLMVTFDAYGVFRCQYQINILTVISNDYNVLFLLLGQSIFFHTCIYARKG